MNRARSAIGAFHDRVADDQQAVPRAKRVIPVGTPSVGTVTDIGTGNLRAIDGHTRRGRTYVAQEFEDPRSLVDHTLRGVGPGLNQA